MIKKAIRRLSPALETQIRDYLYRKRNETSASDFRWKQGPRCPKRRVEGGGVVIGQRVYLFGGYESIDRVHNRCDVFALKARKWIGHFPTPDDAPQTHVGITTDGERYIYTVGGQFGPQCSPCTDRCYVYDTQEQSWANLPPLPKPRYVGVVQYWSGRVHAAGGSMPDRYTPAKDHWSIGVKEGRATESRWQEEPPIPRGGIHRGSALVRNRLYVVGGTEGDVKPYPNDPGFACDWNTPPESFHGELYRLEPGAQAWVKLPDMPVKLGHLDTTTVAVGDYLLTFGGNVARHKCTDIVMRYDTRIDRWETIGHLPYHMKSSFVVYQDNWLYLMTGQRSVSVKNQRPGEVLNTVWMARYPFS
jgi:hypothetical protein